MKLMDDIKKLCKEHGVKLYLPKSKSIKYGNIFISGYFDEKTLACAMGKEDSIFTLIHESCHLDQYLESSKLWIKSDTVPNIDEWLNGKDFNCIEQSLNTFKFLELDCEKRAINKIIKYDIKCNKKEYIQKANAYVQFYNYLKLSRKWCDKNNTPYSNKNVWKLMPKKFMPDWWYEELPRYALKAFIREKI